MDELREAFNEAFDKAEEESEAIDSNEPEQEEVETDAEPEAEPSGEEPEALEGEAEPQAAGEPSGSSETPEKQPVKSKVPASWGAGAKETWANVPEAAQKEILKREAEVNKVLQLSASARRAAETLNRTLEPYKQGLIAAGAQDPFQAIGALLKTEATLRAGTQADKARMIATLVNEYGVDIQSLDSALVGQNPAGETDKFEEMLNAKLAPVNNFLAQQANFQQQQQYEMQANAQQSIAEFSESAEFISDVRNDMADLLDMAASRGQQMSLQEAYNKACALNPEISAIMAKRQKEQQIMGTQQQTNKKKAAAVSWTGKQGGSGGKDGNLSLHDQLAAAWDAQTGA